ncbi:heavy metal translocating P-type ATPase [Ligilactobacillus murinus]|uniref:Cd(2+)-exporting ATPase n=1 Tax=Ligilactobacillus murinus TaxID=1622 RepID=A0A4Q2AX37_9LACO|nr:heavy metal translocating P-type ATPase [Ligilactobacillus murinus]NBH85225.1 cadmium-translocating P-type ATPase [Lachnospiraceae bacterium]AWZ39163.1 cadmium-translocating P-type ATPase [Ligilactobacillus murinus]NBH40591.1 cadmium-translocating P-type ATPase [Ligilactobacillus murinus]RII81044.1 cadmium-translocating P-type ATPase [Ligilactobacillus murinus]RXV74893.1 cadmium-translocating P-type ATPase [Ligilactobacillus murinus]
MKHSTKLGLIIAIALFSAILEFGFGLALVAQIIITVTGTLIALSMLKEMIKTLRSGSYGVDLLAITAVAATLAVGQYWAAMIVLIMLVGGDSLEDYASKKAHTELKALLDNSPQTAHKVVADKLIDIKVDEANIGDQLVVKPGETVPVDGHIIKGSSMFDESSLTGESRPITKNVSDTVYSGSINGDSAITMTVDKLAKDSQYQRLIQLVKQADSTPAHFVRMADRYAVPFTGIAFVIAGIAWFVSKDPVRFAEVLVVASPCPLILAAPVALVSGMSRSSRNGIVVKTGSVLEKMATAKTAAFDKTGTITSGRLFVDQIKPVAGTTKEELLSYAASAERSSGHILARSLLNYAVKHDVNLLEVQQLSEVTGNGVTAQIAGQTIKVGKASFVAPTAQVAETTQTCVYISLNDQYIGTITFIDKLRLEAAQTMQTLRDHGVKHLMMLTGDQQAIAQTIAKEVGIDDVRAKLLPEEKIKALKAVPESEHPVIMVGDGVNDAPSLTVADVGIAMGAHGATAASESADVVILKDDLLKVAKAVEIAQDTLRIARQAVLIGIFICVFLMLVASTGLIPAIVGAMFQEVIDTVSILWGLRARYSHEK